MTAQQPAATIMNMPVHSPAPFLRTLCSLRWLATAGQAAAIVFASQVLAMDLHLWALWSGVAALAVFNAAVQWYLPRRRSAPRSCMNTRPCRSSRP